jgi:N-methylhydantoinase A
MPGPACYNRGGERPTVTDANLVRGFLDPVNFAGGTMQLAKGKAEAAVRNDVGKPLGLDVSEAASLIGLTVEQNMVAAIQEITIRQGVDPREFVMVAGGAAAGLHAVPIARELGIAKVLVPPTAGVLSAFGILVSDIKSSFSRSLPAATDNFDYERVNETLDFLGQEARAYLDRMQVPAAAREIRYSAEARYRGQVWQLTLNLDYERINGAAELAKVVESFHQLHESRYFVRSADPVEFTEWSVVAIGRLPEQASPPSKSAPDSLAVAAKSSRRVYMRELGGEAEIPVFDGTRLAQGSQIAGPAIIDQPLTTIVLYPETAATMSENGGVWIDLH